MSDSPEGSIEWKQSDKFVMPFIPEDLQVDPRTLAILHCVSFLELSGNETVDPDWAIEAMEHVAHYLQRLNANELTQMRGDMEAIASWAESIQLPAHFIDLARRFAEYAGFDPENG